MARQYKVKNKRTGSFLESPHVFGTGATDQLWLWSGREERAHHFPSRKAAKDLLRDPGFRGINFSELTFIPV